MTYKENTLQYGDYFKLRESVGWNNFSKEQIIRALENSLYDIVAVDNEHVVGMGRLIGDGLYYTVVDIVVSPEYQGKGIGSELIKRILDYADSQTPSGGRASIQLIAEKGKEPFYEKMGFKKIPHEYCGAGMRKVIHKKGI
jgi:Predicted acetyltransferase